MNDCLIDEHFEDVRLLVARARKHEAEYNLLANATGEDSWWSIEEQQRADGTYSNTLVVHCQQLKELKPISADLCNNLVHALDQSIGALTRLNGRDNSGKLQFPWKAEDDAFGRSLARLEDAIGSPAAHAIRAAREECRPFVSQAHVAKEVSNSGKHWELVPSSASIPAVAVNRVGARQQIFELPADSLAERLYHIFYEGPERLMQHPMTVVVGLGFSGFGGEQVSPDSVFGSAFRYVATIVEAVTSCPEVRVLANRALT